MLLVTINGPHVEVLEIFFRVQVVLYLMPKTSSYYLVECRVFKLLQILEVPAPCGRQVACWSETLTHTWFSFPRKALAYMLLQGGKRRDPSQYLQ